MFLEKLIEEIRDLPYQEQQLMIKINQLILKEYRKSDTSLSRSKALANLEMTYAELEKIINCNHENSIDTGKCK